MAGRFAAKLQKARNRQRMIKRWSDEYVVHSRPDYSKHDLLDFVPAVSPHLSRPEHFAELAELVKRTEREEVQALVSAPVRHGKSTFFCHAIVWLLLRDPAKKILYLSYGQEFAATQVREVLTIARAAGLELGERVLRGDGFFETAQGGNVRASSFGGTNTGLGYSLVFIDDPHKNRVEAESRLIRDRILASFDSDFLTRRDPGGTSFIVCGARWNQDDLIGSLVGRGWPYVNKPALDANGNALAPWLWPASELEKIRDTINPYAWASLYQGQPMPKGGALFTSPTLVEDTRSAPGARYRYAIGIDLAYTFNRRTDYSAAVVMRGDIDTGHAVVVDVMRAPGSIADKHVEGRVEEGFGRRLARLAERYPGAPIVQYVGGREETVLSVVLDAYGIKVRPVRSVSDKWARAQGYAAAWNVGRVSVPNRASWANDFVDEHLGFTGAQGQVDDQVDAASAAWDELRLDGVAASVDVQRRGSPLQTGGRRKLWT